MNKRKNKKNHLVQGIRKPIPPPGGEHRDKSKYTRKIKHKTPGNKRSPGVFQLQASASADCLPVSATDSRACPPQIAGAFLDVLPIVFVSDPADLCSDQPRLGSMLS